jgi:hypothetical protein
VISPCCGIHQRTLPSTWRNVKPLRSYVLRFINKTRMHLGASFLVCVKIGTSTNTSIYFWNLCFYSPSQNNKKRRATLKCWPFNKKMHQYNLPLGSLLQEQTGNVIWWLNYQRKMTIVTISDGILYCKPLLYLFILFIFFSILMALITTWYGLLHRQWS